MMNAGGAYGGGKAGGSFDPITFVQRPQVLLRGLSWVSPSPEYCFYTNCHFYLSVEPT